MRSRHPTDSRIVPTVSNESAYFHPGATCNPRALGHTPGGSSSGSSSGSATAVADVVVPLALGTQTAGSVIRPAAYCGIVGYKPSHARVARAGVKRLSDTLDTIGTFGRTVRDAALLGAVLTGDRRLLADAPWPAALARTTAARELADGWFGDFDLLLAPSAAGKAPPGPTPPATRCSAAAGPCWGCPASTCLSSPVVMACPSACKWWGATATTTACWPLRIGVMSGCAARRASVCGGLRAGVRNRRDRQDRLALASASTRRMNKGCSRAAFLAMGRSAH